MYKAACKVARKAAFASALAVSLLAAGGARDANAAGVSSGGFTSGVPIYATLPEGLYLLNQTASSWQFDKPDTKVNVEVLFLYYQSPLNFLGGQLAFMAVPIFARVSSDVGPSRSGYFSTFVGAQINWELAEGLYFGYRFAGYLPHKSGEIGLPYGALENRFGFTYLKDGIHATANFMVGKPVDDHGVAPNYFLADFAVAKKFGKWELGVVSHVSTDLNSPGFNYRKQSQWAAGGLIGYDFGTASVQFRVTKDVYEKNYGGKNLTLWTNLFVPLYTVKAPVPTVQK